MSTLRRRCRYRITVKLDSHLVAPVIYSGGLTESSQSTFVKHHKSTTISTLRDSVGIISNGTAPRGWMRTRL